MSNQLQLWPSVHAVEKLRWSISRDRRMRDCLRKYYLYHYGSAGGRRPDADPRTREIYVLKHLRNRFMWVGEVVHALIELCMHAWRRGESPTLEALVQRGVRQMRALYIESVQGLYRSRPGEVCGLVEHAYQENVSRQQWQDMRLRLEQCMRHFLQMPLVQHIRATPSWSWLALEAAGSIPLNGAAMLVKPDFAYRTEAGQVVMVDWKTGGPSSDDRQQLAVYGLYAEKVWGLADQEMQAHLVYLERGEVDTFVLGPAALRAAEAQVAASVGQMRQLAVKGPTQQTPSPEAFVQTDDLSRCARCSFRRPCGREGGWQDASAGSGHNELLRGAPLVPAVDGRLIGAISAS